MKILLLSRWFPPISVIGAVRPYRLARFLADAGHDVVVVCVDKSAHPKDAEADLVGIRVVRIAASRMALFLDPGWKSSGVIRALKGVLRRLFFPDQYLLEVPKYLVAARALHSEGWSPDVVLSSALPFSTHLAGHRVAGYFDAPWVADNRDLWAHSPYQSSLLRRLAEWYERRLLSQAALVVCVGERMSHILRKSLGIVTPVVTVRNGCDEVPSHVAQDNSNEIRFLYTGGLYGGYRDPTPLFRALSDLGVPATVEFVGAEESIVKQYQEQFSHCNIVSSGRISRSECQKKQRSAKFLLLALGSAEFEKTVLTGKFFEYLESGRPVIAICDEDSELAEIVSVHQLGVATRDPRRIADYVARAVELGVPPVLVPDELTRRFQLVIFEKHLQDVARHGE